jgi:hypothetical protein
MKIIIISRSIFPSQFPRSFRATELAIQLAKRNHDVTLYGVLGKYDYKQFEKTNNVKVKNIGKMFFATLNSEGIFRNTLFDKVLWKLLNRIIEYPDIELLFKMPEIIRHEKQSNVLITVGMPYPIHWGCALSKFLYKNYFPQTWIADCGDPYMGNKVINNRPFFYFKYIEKWFCKKADYITIPLEEAKKGYYTEFHQKIKIIPQGFNFNHGLNSDIYIKNPVPTFAYAGSFYKGFRDPSLFLDYLVKMYHVIFI